MRKEVWAQNRKDRSFKENAINVNGQLLVCVHQKVATSSLSSIVQSIIQ